MEQLSPVRRRRRTQTGTCGRYAVGSRPAKAAREKEERAKMKRELGEEREKRKSVEEELKQEKEKTMVLEKELEEMEGEREAEQTKWWARRRMTGEVKGELEALKQILENYGRTMGEAEAESGREGVLWERRRRLRISAAQSQTCVDTYLQPNNHCSGA